MALNASNKYSNDLLYGYKWEGKPFRFSPEIKKRR